MLFMVNPPKRKGKSRKRRTAAQKAATEKMLAARKKSLKSKKKSTKTSLGGAMAKKRTRKRASARRRSTAKRRSPVTTLRRHSVSQASPKRRRRRRSTAVVHRRRSTHRRNPGIVGMIKQSAIDAGATLVGGAAARMASGLLPLPKDGLAGVGTGLGVAVLIRIAAQKVVSHDTARFIGAGAMQVPLKSLITTFVPQAGAFLGDYDHVGAYQLNQPGVGDYLQSGGMASYQQQYAEVGTY